MVNPRDIALAIRLHPNGEAQAASSSSETRKREKDGAELEDLFDEIGMEYLDETEIPEDDDERRESTTHLHNRASSGEEGADGIAIPIVERIRQTLMTHMWPNMVRKPLASSSRGVDEYLDLDDDLDDLDENEQMDQAEASTTVFPISFDPTAHATDAMPVIPDTDIQARDFPGVDELRSQIMLQHLDLENGNTNFRRGQEGFNRLEMLDDDGDDFLDQEAEGDGEDWVQAEYCRLDDWLEEGEGEEGQVTNMTGRHDGGPELENKDNAERDEDEIDQPPNPAVEESQFEDDFADFAPFQSAPPPGGSRAAGGNLPLDPTPLLLHLQNVREELAEMDEDTRRARAGKEVESLFRSLGLGGMDDMEGLLDEDGDEDGEGGEELGEALREIKVDGNEK
jgi:hypothetical protein